MLGELSIAGLGGNVLRELTQYPWRMRRRDLSPRQKRALSLRDLWLAQRPRRATALCVERELIAAEQHEHCDHDVTGL
ncbi:MAG: hypothetical protein QM803_18740 [Rhodocyclaceae bacterium]